MTGTLLSAFEDRNEAQLAVDELHEAGFSKDDIGFALRGSDVYRGGMATDAVGTKDGEGAVKGAATGGVIGGLLGAAAAAIIPGVGPVLAGGILATAFGGAAAGAATGGIFGAMAGLGASEEEAQFFQRSLESGRAVVTVRAGDRLHEAADIVRRHGGYEPEFKH